MTVPPHVRVSVGFGHGAQSESNKILGQAWPRSRANDGVNQIFICPEMDDPTQILAVLIHELIHAADDCQNGHKGPFRRAALALGLRGHMTSTTASPELHQELVKLALKLGPYQHGALNTTTVRKQSTRMRKIQCTDLDCMCGGYTVRTTAKWLAVGIPTCPFGGSMEEA